MDYQLHPLPPSPGKHTQHSGDNSLLTPDKGTATIQAPTPNINSIPHQHNAKGHSRIEMALQDYSVVSLNSQKKKNISKMKKLRNHSQLKEQENSPEAANNETDLCSLTDIEFKREIVKILKELREDMNSNADSFRKELENIRRSQEKLENSFAEMQTELKAIKSRMNNAEE